jgi:hypothetical protein
MLASAVAQVPHGALFSIFVVTVLSQVARVGAENVAHPVGRGLVNLRPDVRPFVALAKAGVPCREGR